MSDILILTIHLTTNRNKKIQQSIRCNKLNFIYIKKTVIYNNCTTQSWHWLVYPILIYGGGKKWVYNYIYLLQLFSLPQQLYTLSLLYNYFFPPLYVYQQSIKSSTRHMLLCAVQSHEIIESKPIKALNLIKMTDADKMYSLVSLESIELLENFINKYSIG